MAVFSVGEKDKPQTKKDMELLMSELANRTFEGISRQLFDQFATPTLENICSLSPMELANLAEAMVNLTSLHRQFTHEEATVGGPTDVALISKGDGFIWVKRKHYFQPELNHHFFRNYFRRCENEPKE